MIKRLKKSGFFMALAVVLLLAACSFSTSSEQESAGDDDASTEQSTEPGASADSRTLTIGLPVDMVSFDIHNHNTTTTEAIHINMFSYLFKRGTDTEIRPDLVEEYKLLDNTTWEMTLKKGVTFHNGDPLTAEDVKFTLERVAKDSSLLEHSNYKQILEVKVLDDYKFQIITDGPQPALLNRLSRIGSGILPKKYIETNGWETFLKEPVGSGPYKFVEWVKDDRVVLEAYEGYFEGPVSDWDRVIFRKVPEDSVRVNELLTGGIDLISSVPPNMWDRINDNGGKTKIVKGPSQNVGLLGVRHTAGFPTADARVREAIDLAIDKETIIKTVLGGAGTPTRTRVTPGNFGADPSLFNTSLYDPERAKKLLAEAGYGNGLEITLHAPSGRYFKGEEVVEMIAGMLANVGIQTKVEFMEFNAYLEARRAGKFKELFFAAFGNSLFDADVALNLYETKRAEVELGYSNPEVDQLLKQAITNMNPQDRAQQYQRIQQIVAEERPHIYLYLQDNIYGINTRIEFTPRTDEMLYVPDIKLKQ